MIRYFISTIVVLLIAGLLNLYTLLLQDYVLRLHVNAGVEHEVIDWKFMDDESGHYIKVSFKDDKDIGENYYITYNTYILYYYDMMVVRWSTKIEGEVTHYEYSTNYISYSFKRGIMPPIERGYVASWKD